MKKMMSALVAVSALAVAVPAAAQSYGGAYPRGPAVERGYGYGHGGNLSRQIEQLDNRVDRAFHNRRISRVEHRSLKAQVQELRRLNRIYLRDGRMTRAERNNLDRRIDRVEARLRYERRDRDGRRW